MPTVTFTTSGGLNRSALREANERLVLNALRLHPTASRSDIARITRLSPSSVTFIIGRLARRKVLSEQATENRSQVGRRPTALRLHDDCMLALGVEISLSGARIVISDLKGTFIQRKEVPWHRSHDVFLNRVNQSIRKIAVGVSPQKLLGAGVGMPGFVERNTGKVIAAENLGWLGVEAGHLLRKGLSCSFYFENLVKLAALAEMWFASSNSRPLRDFVFVCARGGLGTGVIINGQILQGASAAASEFGHTVLYPDGMKCSCGNRGCWEQYASDLAFRRRYKEKSGVEAEPEAIIQRAREGDPAASAVLRENAHHVALGFGNLIVALNPEALIVGDYLAAAWDLIEETVWGVLHSRFPEYYLTGLRIFPSRHSTDAYLLGSCALVFAKFFTNFEQMAAGIGVG